MLDVGHVNAEVGLGDGQEVIGGQWLLEKARRDRPGSRKDTVCIELWTEQEWRVLKEDGCQKKGIHRSAMG